MRDYGKVFSRIWESADFRALSDDGRMLVMYLLTCQHGTISGVFRLPDGYACEDTGWTAERVSKGFADLTEKGFAHRCATSKWVWIVKFLQWNAPENPNQRKAAVKQALAVPAECSWRAEFLKACGASLGIENPSLTVVEGLTQGLQEPFLNQKQKQKQEQKDSPEPLQGSGPATGFAIPLNDQTEFEVPAAMLTDWKAAFPAVDVQQELREMRAWCNANRENRKTRRGVERFIVRWLQKAQDTPSRRKPGGDGAGGDWTRTAT